jgi:hypothetical protein
MKEILLSFDLLSTNWVFSQSHTFLWEKIFFIYTRIKHHFLFFQIVLRLFQLKNISKIGMTSLVDTLPIVPLSTNIPQHQLLPKTDVTIEMDQYRQSCLMHGKGRKAVLVQKDSDDTSCLF